MKLSKKSLVTISFMLFSLFFGAGNLIFPPLLGQQAGENAIWAFIGFVITAVVLPVLGVIVVGKMGGLSQLAGKVGSVFSIVFTVLIYLSIGPGLGIPRAGSVPFEMAILPYLPTDANVTLWRVVYTTVFFAIVLWLCLNPGKLVKRIGNFLTPSLLALIVVMFVAFLFRMDKVVAPPQDAYQSNAFLQGFVDGYQTMDAVAALNFGLVISLTLTSFGVKDDKGVVKYTVIAGIFAGLILTIVYVMLTVMGSATSGIYTPDANGALILRHIIHDLFGEFGAVLLAAIFTLACLTTCVGLTNSISAYFEKLFKKVSYKWWVVTITVLSFLICNLGLDAILSISVPILNAIYPVAIVLILLGLFGKYFHHNKLVYQMSIYATTAISIVYALDSLVDLGAVSTALAYLPLYSQGFGWVLPFALMLAISLPIALVQHKKKNTQTN